MKTPKLIEYALVEHRPCSEGGPNFFASNVEGLDEKPELWENECPYSVRHGRVVKSDAVGVMAW